MTFTLSRICLDYIIIFSARRRLKTRTKVFWIGDIDRLLEGQSFIRLCLLDYNGKYKFKQNQKNIYNQYIAFVLAHNITALKYEHCISLHLLYTINSGSGIIGDACPTWNARACAPSVRRIHRQCALMLRFCLSANQAHKQGAHPIIITYAWRGARTAITNVCMCVG